MSFYTSLSGLNAAQTDLNVTSNNIANAGTTGFKSSRADFGDIIASSALQAQNSVIGQGTQLKSISQEFSQGSTETTGQALDMLVSGEGFFVTKASGTGSQVSFTRDGSFTVNPANNTVVDAAGNQLQALPIDSQGNVTASGLSAMQSLYVPPTNGTPKATSQIGLSLTFPSDADLPASRSAYASTPYAFSPDDPNSYNDATSTTVYDSSGTAIPATVYYVRDTAPAADGSSTDSSWTAHMMVGDKEVFPNGGTTPLTLTFGKSGALTSPATATYGAAQPTGAVAPITLTVDYGTATKQGAYAFDTVASSQDGTTTGKLNNLTIGTDGLVSASYADGSSLKLGKIAVATFANTSGLHQNGNTTWTATGASGDPQIAAAGNSGRGDIQSGALETSNVDLTAELVNLISAQRNFQANAKAIDTDKQMIESVINLQ